MELLLSKLISQEEPCMRTTAERQVSINNCIGLQLCRLSQIRSQQNGCKAGVHILASMAAVRDFMLDARCFTATFFGWFGW